MTRSLLAIAALLATWLPAGGSHAQQEEPAAAAQELDEATKEAIEHFKKGVKFFEKEKFEAALVEFLKSHELKPNWALRYNIGICYDETDRPVEALAQLKLYLEEGGDKIPADRRVEVEGLIATLEQVLGYLTIGVDEDGAQILIDDFTKLESPVASPVPLEAGFHRIEVRKSGFEAFKTKVTIASGETIDVKVDLVAIETGDEGPMTWDGTLPPGGGEPETRKPLTGIWIGLGAGGGLAIAAAVTGGMVLSSKNKMLDAADACESTLTRDDCPDAYRYQDRAKGLRVATNVLWGVAGAAAVTGLVIFLASKPKAVEKAEQPDAEPAEVTDVSVLPVVAPGAGGGYLGIETTLKF